MRAKIRSILSLDVDHLASWIPASEKWSLGLRMMVGPDGRPGEEAFDLTICSLPWLADRVRAEGLVDGRHLLVVDAFNWPVISAFVEERVRQASGATWADVALKLSRFGHWEFEDYEE